MLSIVHHSIGQLIQRYQSNKFLNVREADYCSELVSSVRAILKKPTVAAHLYGKDQRSTFAEPIIHEVVTSRVHQEVTFSHAKVDTKSDESHPVEGTFDIVFLKDVQVRLFSSSISLERYTWAQYRVEDVEAAIEIKCTPLHSSDIEDIIKDLEKLKSLGQNGVKELHFVQINTGNKSLFSELGGVIRNNFSIHKKSHHTGTINVWDSNICPNPTFESGADAYNVSGVQFNPMTVYF